MDHVYMDWINSNMWSLLPCICRVICSIH